MFLLSNVHIFNMIHCVRQSWEMGSGIHETPKASLIKRIHYRRISVTKKQREEGLQMTWEAGGDGVNCSLKVIYFSNLQQQIKRMQDVAQM